MSELEIQQMQEKIDVGILLAQKCLIEKAKKENAELVVEQDCKVVRIKAKDLKCEVPAHRASTSYLSLITPVLEKRCFLVGGVRSNKFNLSFHKFFCW